MKSPKVKATPFPLVFRLTFVVMLTLILLLMAEAGLRLFGPDLDTVGGLVTRTDDPRGFALTPDNTIHFDGLREPLPESVTWRINGQGIRANHPIAPSSGKFRIAVYGDSEAFGWGVNHEDTFQRQMEMIDDRVEVINMGVPGYNITNISAAIEQTALQLRPDLLLYLVHENDFDDPLDSGQLTARSYLVRMVKLVYYGRVSKRRERSLRASQGRAARFVEEIDRISTFGDRHDIPIILAFLEWGNRHVMVDYAARRGRATKGKSMTRFADLPPQLNLKPIINDEVKVDRHFTADSYRKIARFLCAELSGEPQSACMPVARGALAGQREE